METMLGVVLKVLHISVSRLAKSWKPIRVEFSTREPCVMLCSTGGYNEPGVGYLLMFNNYVDC